MRTEEIILNAAIIGCLVSMAFAWFCLVVATGNYILASIAVFAILCTITGCVGFMRMAGWTFGFIESVCIIICVGFSIDYAAHLAVAYNEAPDTSSRYERTRRALGELGISVTAAAITTCAAAICLLPNRMKPFTKIGVFVVFDVACALFFAVGLFCSLLVLVGPIGGQGSLRGIYARFSGSGGGGQTGPSKVAPSS